MKLIPFLFCVSLVLSGCSVSVSIAADDNAGAAFSLHSAMGPAIEKTLRAVSGLNRTDPLFNAEQMNLQLSAAGFEKPSVSVADVSILDISAYIRNLSDGISTIPGVLVYSKTSNGSHRLVFTLSPEILQKAVAVLADKEKNYIDLLMAPVFTGESMSQTDYLDLVASVYGQSIADELKTSSLVITMYAPSPYHKSRKFSIQLADLLTLSDRQISETLDW